MANIQLILSDNPILTLTANSAVTGRAADLTGATLETHLPMEDGSELVIPMSPAHTISNQATNKGQFLVDLSALVDQTPLMNLRLGFNLPIRTKVTWPGGHVINFKASILDVLDCSTV